MLSFWHPGAVPTARERVRAELTAEITDAARRQLAEVGAAALSLRAVARELGMASSAVYRYFPSRDDLLTRLIIDGYDDLGAAAEAADDPAAAAAERWLAVCRAVRTWALAHPHEYALLYGSPVPGYGRRRTPCRPRRASASSSAGSSARRRAAGALPTAAGERDADAGQRRRRRRPRRRAPVARRDRAGARPAGLERALGTISFELFGHFVGSVEDGDRYFDRAMADLARLIGF